MNAPKAELRRQARRLDYIGASQRVMAADLGVSRRRARQLIADFRTAEQRFEEFLAAADPAELAQRLADLQNDRRWLDRRIAAAREELESRRTDEAIGLR